MCGKMMHMSLAVFARPDGTIYKREMEKMRKLSLAGTDLSSAYRSFKTFSAMQHRRYRRCPNQFPVRSPIISASLNSAVVPPVWKKTTLLPFGTRPLRIYSSIPWKPLPEYTGSENNPSLRAR